MSYFTETLKAPIFAGQWAELKSRIQRYRVYRNTLDELQSLSSRELNDLGLNQSTLKRVAYEAAYGK